MIKSKHGKTRIAGKCKELVIEFASIVKSLKAVNIPFEVITKICDLIYNQPEIKSDVPEAH